MGTGTALSSVRVTPVFTPLYLAKYRAHGELSDSTVVRFFCEVFLDYPSWGRDSELPAPKPTPRFSSLTVSRFIYGQQCAQLRNYISQTPLQLGYAQVTGKPNEV